MSGASSLRNAVKRVTHKERAQPSWRKNAGFLEKHKDYIVRARDYQKKKSQIVSLKKKAADRNPDEFYFKMNKSKVTGGVHENQADSTLDIDTVKLLKTQDLGYMAHRKAVDDSKARKLKGNLHLIGESAPRDHKIFVSGSKEFDYFDPITYFDTAPELVDRSFNRLKKSQLNSNEVGAIKTSDMKKSLKLRERSYKELNQRVKRAEKINSAIQSLQVQRLAMSKGTKTKVEDPDGIKPTVYKFKRQRSK